MLAEVTSEESINSFNMWVFLSSSVRVGGEEKQSAACFCRKCPLIIQLIMRNLERGNLPKKNPPTFSHHRLNLSLALTRICIRDGVLEWSLMKASEVMKRGKQ